MVDDSAEKKMQDLVARAWTDPDFKRALLDDPRAVLEGQGAEIPDGVEVRAVEETERVIYLVLPLKPTLLSDLDLEQISAGGGLDLFGWFAPWMARLFKISRS